MLGLCIKRDYFAHRKFKTDENRASNSDESPNWQKTRDNGLVGRVNQYCCSLVICTCLVLHWFQCFGTSSPNSTTPLSF